MKKYMYKIKEGKKLSRKPLFFLLKMTCETYIPQSYNL